MRANDGMRAAGAGVGGVPQLSATRATAERVSAWKADFRAPPHILGMVDGGAGMHHVRIAIK
jgi:hypothetical protein